MADNIENGVIDLTSTQASQPKPDLSRNAPSTPCLYTCSSIPDRLPTVSAAQALQGLDDGSSNNLPTGIKSLDSRLAVTLDESTGGLERGKVTELWGPSGSGKTAIAYVQLRYWLLALSQELELKL
jgi:hypothetical protein